MSLLKILLIVLLAVLVVLGVLVYVSLRSNGGLSPATQQNNTVIDTSNVTETSVPGQVNIPKIGPTTP